MKIKKTRRSPIAKSLIKNSVSAYLAAVEIHNKPIFKYRYEIVVILVISAWELLLKAYIYKKLKHVKIFLDDGRTKDFPECLDCIYSTAGKDFYVTYENISKLYEFRNKFVHFYSETIDVIIFSLLKKNVNLYSDFCQKHFALDIGKLYDFVLLPIGFKKIYSPIDFISNESAIKGANPHIKEFIGSVINSIKRLESENIDESIIVDFSLSLINEKNIKNADIIAGVNNFKDGLPNFTVMKQIKQVSTAKYEEGLPVRIVGSKENAEATLIFTEIQDGIFEEINNILESNRLLSQGAKAFMFGEEIYYRVYAERQHVTKKVDNYDLLFKAGVFKFNAPSIYWIISLPDKYLIDLLNSDFSVTKSDPLMFILRISCILGNDYLNRIYKKMENLYSKVTQPPEHYFSAKRIIDCQHKNPALKALRIGLNQKLMIPSLNKEVIPKDIVNDKALCAQLLSETCMQIFKGNKGDRRVSKLLDFIAYEKNLEEKKESIRDQLEW